MQFFVPPSFSNKSLLFICLFDCHCRMQKLLSIVYWSAKSTKRIWFEDLYMSLIYKRKSTGPHTKSYETPNVMFDIEELQFLIETYCFLLLKYDSNQCCMTPLTPLCRSLLINMLWLTVSNNFEKSRYTSMVLCLLSKDEYT